MIGSILSRRAAMTHSAQKLPLIVVIGATGTGKSDLAIALSERFNGEIINGDALQLYEGLPIATNKVPGQERRGIPHHLLGQLKVEQPTWTVGKFVKEAERTISEIRSRGKIPVLVGGTHYYTQSLIFKDQTVDNDHFEPDEEVSEKWPILNSSNEEILEKLREVDPVMASRWHPNDSRKIRRSLEIWLQTGRPASEIYEEQRSTRASISTLEPSVDQMREDVLLFWIHADSEPLNDRLAQRVEKMVEQGLLEEIQQLRQTYLELVSHGLSVDKTRGIWVAIGYKEFEDYLISVESGDARGSLRDESVEKSKIATRQYAKRQVRWIRRKLLPAFKEAQKQDRVFLLDGSSIKDWKAEVEDKSVDITSQFLHGDRPDPLGVSSVADRILTDCYQNWEPTSFGSQKCEPCDRVFITEKDWKAHVQSGRHKTAVRKAASVVA